MSDGPPLLRASRHERWLPAHRRNVENELDSESPFAVLIRCSAIHFLASESTGT
jgi:hypothetical protein